RRSLKASSFPGAVASTTRSYAGTALPSARRRNPDPLLAWPAMDPASQPSMRASGSVAIVFAGLVGAALLGATFAGDGSDVHGTFPVGGAAIVLLTAALVGVAFGWLPALHVGRSGAAFVGGLVLLVAWTGVTVRWSIVGDRSWDVFNKDVAF